MKSTRTLRFPIQRLFLLTLVSFVAIAALLSIAASANKANRSTKTHAEQATNTKSAINPSILSDKQQPLAPSAAVIVATLTDNVTAATKIAPGATINYTATITNNGAASPADDASALNFSAQLDPNTTLVANSIHASPIALNDTYNWVGNTQLDTAARALPAVAANDVAVNATGGTDTFTVTAIAGGATVLGGTVTLASPSGAFTYTPPLGRPNIADGTTVQDSFTYTITNNADPTLTSIGTVRINLTGRVWYLQAGAAGDGRSNTPSSSPAAMSTAADKSTDVFYIFSNAASLNGPFSVDAGQQLLGQGVNLVVSAITLFNAAGPTPTTTNTAGSCVALAGAPGNNTLSGFNIGNCTGGTGITGANVGTLNVSTMSINTNGGALDLTGVGTPTASVVLGGTTSTGGARNVSLVGLNGTFTLAGGALSGATGNALNVDGGNAGITFSGTISNSGGRQVNIINKASGTVALSGAISGTGTGVFLNANGTSIFNLTGGVVLSTTTNDAFTATNSGTLTVTGATNTLTTTTGQALRVVSTTVAATGLTFQSISSNGGANNGITMDTTGGLAGLTVTGSGGTCTTATPTCTGGTIVNKTGADGSLTSGIGIYLNSTINASLTRMSIQGHQNHGIRGGNVTGFTLDNSIVGTSAVNGTSNTADVDATGFGGENSVRFFNLLGSATISNSTLDQGFSKTIGVANNTGTLNRLTITNCTVRQSLATATASDSLFMASTASAVVNFTVTGGSVFNATRQFHVDTSASGASTMDIQINNTAFSNTINPVPAGGGLQLGGSGTDSLVTFDINNCSLRHGTGAAVPGINNVGRMLTAGMVSGNGKFDGKFTNNTVGVAGIARSGAGDGADGIGLFASGSQAATTRGTGTTHSRFLVQNNIIKRYGEAGIVINARQGNSILDATVLGNTINEPGTAALGAFAAIWVNAGALPADTSRVDVVIGAASVAGNKNTMQDSDPSNATDVFLDRSSCAGCASTLNLYRNGSGAAAGQSEAIARQILVDNNLGTLDLLAGFTNGGGGTIGTPAGTPPAPLAAIPISGKSISRQVDKGLGSSASNNPIIAAKTELAKTPVTPVVRVWSKDDMASVQAKTTPKVSAAEMARIYGDDRPISHHAMRRSYDGSAQQPNAPTSGETITLIPIATFPAGGKSITIKYSATVNTPPLARLVQTQGTVTANGGISVQTDDPEPGGGNDQTATQVNALMTWNGTTSTDWNTATNWTQPAGGAPYAPGVSNPAVNEVVIPNVGNQPSISATDIGVFSLSIANGRTLTITSPRVLTIGGAPGGDLTLDGIISGGNLNLGTGTHAINNAGGTGSLSSTNVATVLSGSTVTLNNNLQAGALAVNAGGSMNITGRTLSLNGSGPALVVPGGATFTTATSTVIFNGAAAQQAAGIVYNNLTINNTIGANVTGVTLTGNATVNGILALTSSDLATGAFVLSQPNTTASTGVSDVIGTVTRTAAFGTTTITFGNPNNQITFGAAGTKPTSLTVILAKAPPATYAAAVQRNYTISQVGTNTSLATLRLRYLDTEVSGFNAEATLNLRRLRTGDSHWVAQIPGTVDTTNNWVESATVAAADLPTQWTFSSLSPTAADGIVTGRIVDANGNPVEGAVVRLNGTQNRKFITDANGVYRFDNVETGGFYTVTPSRANFEFSPSVRSFNQLGQETQAIFTAGATGQTANPLDTPEYFVRQHYLDFLGREPDEAGFNFWSDQIIECGGDATCTERRRENVSAAYFLSIEFQKTGGLVDGLYRAGYGARPQFADFMPDTRAVGFGVRVGEEGWEAKLAANKQAFVNAFVNRPAFHARYDGMDHSTFVQALINNTGVTFSSSERDAWVGGLTTGNMTRADVVRSIAENGTFVNAKFNDTFVMMQYFGYLRRDADASGFAFWLNKLNEFNGNFEQAEMVKAFIVSGEFRDRFPR
jgi:hypothetical protein